MRLTCAYTRPLSARNTKMTVKIAQQIGSKNAIISVVTGLVIAQCIMMYFSFGDSHSSSILWFVEFGYTINILAGVILSLITAHYFGKIAGKRILIDKKNSIITGIATGFAIILTTTFFASLIGFFQEGIQNVGTNDNPFVDYIIKPIFWVLFFGLIPVLLVGTLFGKSINRHITKDL